MAAPKAGPVRLVLSESAEVRGQPAPWIGPLLALGTRVARYSRKGSGRQLIIALSVPKRDYAASLVGCGWVLASAAPVLPSALETLREMEPGQPLRAVSSQHVITGKFLALKESARPPRAYFAGTGWIVSGLRAIAPLAELDQPERQRRPEPGSLEHMARLDLAWDARLALPAADLAIVGTMAWLREDLDGHIVREGDDLPSSTIGAILMPKMERVATWFTRLYASARLPDCLPLPQELRAVILDGNGAIKYLAEIEAPVVICVFDRSIADETAAELVIQLRNTRGEPMSVSEDLSWTPPIGIEAMAFSVAL